MAEQNSLAGVRIACLSTNGFEWAELADPKNTFEQSGATVDVIAPDSGEIYGMKHHDKAGTVKVDRTLDDADPDDYAAILLPGGTLTADCLRAAPPAHKLVQT